MFVASGTVANETLGYFMVRIMKFLTIVGVDANRLRFRQVRLPSTFVRPTYRYLYFKTCNLENQASGLVGHCFCLLDTNTSSI